MKKNELLNKAYCGDGLLKYCLGKIFFNGEDDSRKYAGFLGNNSILAKIVKKNPEIFEEYKLDGISKSAEHSLGTIYEAHLFEIHEKEGIKKCIEFVVKTYEIKENESVYELLGKWNKFEI